MPEIVRKSFTHLSEYGFLSVAKKVVVKIKSQIIIVGRKTHWWFFYKNWFAGKYVEMRGNVGYISGLRFELDNPSIATFLKCRFLFNTYEQGTHELIDEYLKPDLPVVELGGCIGVSACITNVKLKNKDDHVVLEAQPNLIETLKKNRDQNNCKFEIINGALDYNADKIDFWINPVYFIGSGAKARGKGQIVQVQARTLNQIISVRGYQQITLMVDIEGTEIELIDNELELISTVVDTLIMELHPQEWGAGFEATERLKEKLLSAGFICPKKISGDHVFLNTRYNKSVTELVDRQEIIQEFSE